MQQLQNSKYLFLWEKYGVQGSNLELFNFFLSWALLDSRYFCNGSKFVSVGYYFQDSLVTATHHLISAAPVNNWARETQFSSSAAPPCNLWLLPWVCRVIGLLPLAFSFIIYFIYCRAQNKLELAKMESETVE